MDAFYASVEQRDNPSLYGKPIAVGGSKERGVVAAASYEAREFGVRSAMSSKLAFQKCPELIFVKPRFEVYKGVSSEIHKVFEKYTDIIEPLSLDEAYLDVSENKMGIKSATVIANNIREEIYSKVNLTASAGISINKFLAKMASDINKPNGYKVIPPSEVDDFVKFLPIGKFYGVGKVAESKLKDMGIYYGRDVLIYSKDHLVYKFGKFGNYLYDVARGIDNRRVISDRKRKSIGVERTFEKDLETIDDVYGILNKINDMLSERVEKQVKKGRTIVLKIKFYDFEQVTRSRTLETNTYTKPQILSEAKSMFKEIGENFKAIRLLGLSLTNFVEENKDERPSQLTFEF